MLEPGTIEIFVWKKGRGCITGDKAALSMRESVVPALLAVVSNNSSHEYVPRIFDIALVDIASSCLSCCWVAVVQ